MPTLSVSVEALQTMGQWQTCLRAQRQEARERTSGEKIRCFLVASFTEHLKNVLGGGGPGKLTACRQRAPESEAL